MRHSPGHDLQMFSSISFQNLLVWEEELPPVCVASLMDVLYKFRLWYFFIFVDIVEFKHLSRILISILLDILMTIILPEFLLPIFCSDDRYIHTYFLLLLYCSTEKYYVKIFSNQLIFFKLGITRFTGTS